MAREAPAVRAAGATESGQSGPDPPGGRGVPSGAAGHAARPHVAEGRRIHHNGLVQVVEVDGDEGRIAGRSYGLAVADVIPAVWAAYLTVFERLAHLDRAAVLATGGAVLDLVQGWRPTLVTEMEGVAAGSGAPVEVIAALNARSELVVRAECTTIGRAHSPTGPWLAQNWDWYCDVPERCVVVARPGFTTFTEAGILAKVGLNAQGLALTLNMLQHESDRRAPIGVPAHLVIRELLGTCRSVADVADLVGSVDVSASFCLTVLTADGDAALFEVTPAGVARLEPDDDGLLAHANAVESPGLAGGDRGLDAGTSKVRLEALRRERPLSLDDGRAALSSHADGPGSICRHDEPQPFELPSGGTAATVLMDPATGTMEAGCGPPCQSELQRVEIRAVRRSP